MDGVPFVSYSGKSNVGFHMKVNEDYIYFNDTGFGEDNLFCSIADGSGSKESMFRPASIATHQVEKFLERIYKRDPDVIKDHIRILMEEAFLVANDVLISFKLGDEAERLNFATTLSCIFLERDGTMTFAHAGNTRIYLLRDAKPIQLTVDHTDGQKLVDQGVITEEGYYTAIERLRLYNGLGIMAEPVVQTGRIRLKNNDVIIMTTDGIHYVYKPDAFFDILMQTKNMDEATEQMVNNALKLRTFPDNISVNAVWYFSE